MKSIGNVSAKVPSYARHICGWEQHAEILMASGWSVGLRITLVMRLLMDLSPRSLQTYPYRCLLDIIVRVPEGGGYQGKWMLAMDLEYYLGEVEINRALATGVAAR